MKIFYSYLNDDTFLKELAKEHVKTYFVKITVLDWDEQPVSLIEGRVISANLNIDGQSSLRRTASLSIAIDDMMNEITNANNILSINKKITLEIGYKNTLKKYLEYPILWFPLGLYVIMSSSISESSSGLVASLQLQDKMCLLNGSAGGTIPAAADLHLIDTIDENGQNVTTYPTMYQIIQQLVHHWGGEQLGKIIISDLDNKVKQAMKWNLETPLYYIESGNQNYFFLNEEQFKNKINEYKDGNYSTRIFTKGQDVGFIYVDFTYPGELIADAGSTVTDMLDQIIQVLENYEYFYDLDGNFIFQEKKNYLNNAQSKYILDAKNNVKKDSEGKIIIDEKGNTIPDPKLIPDYVASLSGRLNTYLIDMTKGTSIFDFEDSNLITSYSNTPQYGSIKNDFVIWGLRNSSDNSMEIPLRYHLAIDNPPIIKSTKYKMFNLKEYKMDKYGIWVMPILLNYDIQDSKYGNPHSSDENLKPNKNEVGHYYFDGEKITTAKKVDSKWKWIEVDAEIKDITAADWRTQLLLEGAAAQARGLESNYYYAELKVEWPKIYDLENQKYYDQVLTNPTGINYYLDFINGGGSKILELSVKNIGRRSYVQDKGKSVNCVFESWIPDLILIKNGQEDTQEKVDQAQRRGQIFSQVSSLVYNNLQIGGVYYSAYEEIRQTLHEFTNYNESITLQTIPLYFLQPNTRITVNNPTSDITGDYIINSLSFSLDNEGLLNINASKALERI